MVKAGDSVTVSYQGKSSDGEVMLVRREFYKEPMKVLVKLMNNGGNPVNISFPADQVRVNSILSRASE